MNRCDKWLDNELYDIVMRLRLFALRVREDAADFGNPLEKKFYNDIADSLFEVSLNVQDAQISLFNVKEYGFKND